MAHICVSTLSKLSHGLLWWKRPFWERVLDFDVLVEECVPRNSWRKIEEINSNVFFLTKSLRHCVCQQWTLKKHFNKTCLYSENTYQQFENVALCLFDVNHYMSKRKQIIILLHHYNILNKNTLGLIQIICVGVILYWMQNLKQNTLWESDLKTHTKQNMYKYIY